MDSNMGRAVGNKVMVHKSMKVGTKMVSITGMGICAGSQGMTTMENGNSANSMVKAFSILEMVRYILVSSKTANTTDKVFINGVPASFMLVNIKTTREMAKAP